uniref:Reverse transcriptase domain-containing protein n=1 Tax=Haemonchus contortus TaxID=6289 RepID=A0A7I4Y1R4_HAECO
MLLNKLQALQPNGACVIESFDVGCLYTNVSNVSAMEAVLELLNQYQSMINMHGFSIDQVMSLLKECLGCNIFEWSGEYFEQIRGLAMGQRLAPILEHRPMPYCRSIDDCFVVCSTQEQMEMCFDLLNTQSAHIRLTRERPSESWLPFLYVQVKLHSGMLSTKWYRKPSNKNIIVHCHSAHPFQTKRAVVRNMFRTAASVRSGENERRESVKMAHEIAAFNGYVHFSTSHKERNAVTNNRPRGTSLNGRSLYHSSLMSLALP